jgi:hypothetical protein
MIKQTKGEFIMTATPDDWKEMTEGKPAKTVSSTGQRAAASGVLPS